MKEIEHKYPVYEFRPLYQGEMMRYNDGNWIPDDGEYDIAFIAPDQQTVFGINIPYYEGHQWAWAKDGNWGAHVDEHPGGNAWHYQYVNGARGASYRDRGNHPNIVAHNAGMKKIVEGGRCGNGVSVDMYVQDKTIQAKQVRNRETKEVLYPPKIFNCMYCGEHNLEELNQLK